ncbi:MAG: methionyl-tRNA formyltransferase [Candidatus Omnitrophota bacterium]
MMRIVFFGTPEFAAPTLKVLLETPEIDIVGVLSQPDRPSGRGKRLQAPPVKLLALERGLEILQPEKLRHPGVFEWLASCAPDAIVVVAYGGFVPQNIRELPKYGCVNLHPSLLPKYRGAAPIHWPILNGDEETGNTTIYLAGGWDNGDIIYQEREPILQTDTYGTLAARLAEKGARLMAKTLLDMEKGIAPRIPQVEGDAVFAPMIANEDARIDWNRSACDIHNQVRGMNPVPGAYTAHSGKRWKILRTEIITKKPGEPGTILSTEFNTIRVSAADAIVEILELQPEGKKAMTAGDFLRGHPALAGSKCE